MNVTIYSEEDRKNRLRNVQRKIELTFRRIERIEAAQELEPCERNELLLKVKKLDLEKLERIESQLLRPGKMIREDSYAGTHAKAQ